MVNKIRNVRMDDETHQRFLDLARRLGVPLGVCIKLLLDTGGALPLSALAAVAASYVEVDESYLWAGDEKGRARFEEMRTAAIRAGDARLAAFAAARLAQIDAQAGTPSEEPAR